ncbi:MAG: hypothetical protein ABI921_15680 [Panacibacter sp.]
MNFRILPKETIRISTEKSEEYFLHALNESFGAGKNKKIVFWSIQSNFEIRKTVYNNRSYSKIIAKGNLNCIAGKTIIELEISTEDLYLKFFAFFWYVLNFLLLILLIYMAFKSGEFNFALLIPLAFIFLGYGFTNATLESEIDQLVEDIKRFAK